MSNFEDLEQAFAEGRLASVRHEQKTFDQPTAAYQPNYIKVCVLDVIHDPSKMTDEYISYIQHNFGISNIQYARSLPRNSIIGTRLMADVGPHTMPMFYLPFFPSHLAMPVKPGEHVWVFLDNPTQKDTDIGWWVSRIVGFNHTDDVNHSHAPRDYDQEFYKQNLTSNLASGNTDVTYDFLNGSGQSDPDTKERFAIADTRAIPGGADAYVDILTNSNASKLITYECVPRYKKRPGDLVLEGSNNQVIAFCTDRNFKTDINDQIPVDDITGKNTGAIDLVVGRGQATNTSGVSVTNTLNREELAKSDNQLTTDEGNPDFVNDRSRILIAGKTLLDVNFGLASYNQNYLSSPSVPSSDASKDNLANETSGGIVIQSDKIRMLARSDVVIYATSYTKDVEGNLITEQDQSKWASICIKASGDIVLKPGSDGALFLGGEDADKGLFVSDTPCQLNRSSGAVSGVGPISTMGGQMITGVTGQGKWADRILVKS